MNADWGSVTATVETDKAWSPPPEGSMGPAGRSQPQGQLGTTAARTARAPASPEEEKSFQDSRCLVL